MERPNGTRLPESSYYFAVRTVVAECIRTGRPTTAILVTRGGYSPTFPTAPPTIGVRWSIPASSAPARYAAVPR